MLKVTLTLKVTLVLTRRADEKIEAKFRNWSHKVLDNKERKQ